MRQRRASETDFVLDVEIQDTQHPVIHKVGVTYTGEMTCTCREMTLPCSHMILLATNRHDVGQQFWELEVNQDWEVPVFKGWYVTAFIQPIQPVGSDYLTQMEMTQCNVGFTATVPTFSGEEEFNTQPWGVIDLRYEGRIDIRKILLDITEGARIEPCVGEGHSTFQSRARLQRSGSGATAAQSKIQDRFYRLVTGHCLQCLEDASDLIPDV